MRTPVCSSGLRALAVCIIVLAVIIPARDAFPQFPISGVKMTDERAPYRLIVKAETESLISGPKAATVVIDNLREKTKHFGEPAIAPLIPAAAIECNRLSAGVTTPHPAAQVFVFDFAEDVDPGWNMSNMTG
ncbi:hypothetical protein ACFLQW_04650 [Candidatus Zixiibacteriota bacterium]